MLAVVTCYFNPANYQRRRRNWGVFARCLANHSPLFVAELSFDGAFHTDAQLKIRGETARHMMWQKERLLNRVVQSLPDEYDKVAWVDSDIVFLNDCWMEEAQEKLDEYPIVQLFDNVLLLDPHGRVRARHISLAASLSCAENERPVKPGFAWAARRELWPLLERCIVGGADWLMAYAWLGRRETGLTSAMNPAWRRHYDPWAARAFPRVQGRIGCVRGDLAHLWHGSAGDRKYLRRWKYLTDHDYDPAQDVDIDQNGLLAWASHKPEMQRQCREYFQERREDG